MNSWASLKLLRAGLRRPLGYPLFRISYGSCSKREQLVEDRRYQISMAPAEIAVDFDVRKVSVWRPADEGVGTSQTAEPR